MHVIQAIGANKNNIMYICASRSVNKNDGHTFCTFVAVQVMLGKISKLCSA